MPLLCNIYRPPKDVNKNYGTCIDDSVDKLKNLKNILSDVIVAGNYDIDLLKINDKPIISDYFDTITSHVFFLK